MITGCQMCGGAVTGPVGTIFDARKYPTPVPVSYTHLIVTGKRKYGNMLLEKLTVTTTPDSEHALMVTAECREVIIVRTQVMAVPAEPGRHRNPAKTGGTANKGQKQAVPVR